MIDLHHLFNSPAGLLTAALAAIVFARLLFRVAFRVVMAFAVIGLGTVAAGSMQLPAGLGQHLQGFREVLHQAIETATAMVQAAGVSVN